ncbi:unnamed protein product [Microthlaspi erraticum]|uniref:Receptor-like serine/threonine-protein kinase n=1 Tax=Microthlaspi erraticum TaxID=1685480 RepID=A0A6D2JI34_9BRAS|nr:unnamed protein product [Microthlaspi erraticum]
MMMRNRRHSSVLFVLIALFSSILSSRQDLEISGNVTISSPGNIFELGFFKISAAETGNGDRWYLGMWYKDISPREYVWVANRNQPLLNSNGVVKVSNANLVLLDQSGSVVWSSNVEASSPRYPVMAELLSNGNLVLRYKEKKKKKRASLLWQSFDFPTDTLIPGMRIGLDSRKGVNISLSSWRSTSDPSVGRFSYRVEIQGIPELFLWDRDAETPIYRNTLGDVRFSLTNTSYALREDEKGLLRLKLTSGGRLERWSWSPTTGDWTLLWALPTDLCDLLEWGKCGDNSFCRLEQGMDSEGCECFKGFRQGRSRCVRETDLPCNGNGFQRLANVKLPDTKEAILARSIDSKECRKRCLKDCYCTGYANMVVDVGIGGIDCLIYRGNLFDTRTLTAEGGQDLYVKVPHTYLDKGARINTKNKLVIVSGAILVVSLTFAMFWWWCRKRILSDLQMDGGDTTNSNKDPELPHMDFGTICEATNDFCDSNKLGEGGFGIVYKGRLADGNEIAVKRLIKVSLEGASQFMNEVRLISMLQHINLVRLLGYCVQGADHLVVYEFLQNLSLDFYLFGDTERSRLTWPVRYSIIHGIARGLTYLHQDSCFRIIHRDLKASNILLDKDMLPKISDFGTARLVGRDETQTSTRQIAGTRGYMSPEYLYDGIFSDKSDVYSFGVLLLELLSGKRSYMFINSYGDTSLLAWIWRKFEEGRLLEVIDPIIVASLASPATEQNQIIRYFHISLLCVQRRAQDRPTMSSVVVMLSSGEAVPRPNPPGFCDHFVRYSSFEIGSTSTGPSADDSVLEGR